MRPQRSLFLTIRLEGRQRHICYNSILSIDRVLKCFLFCNCGRLEMTSLFQETCTWYDGTWQQQLSIKIMKNFIVDCRVFKPRITSLSNC